MGCSLVVALAFSSHVGLEHSYNEVHPSLKCDRHDTGVVAGAYYNSERHVSLYAGMKFVSRDNKVWAELGAVTGYEGHDVLPFVRIGYAVNDSVSVFVAPIVEESAHGNKVGVLFGLEVAFQRD